MTSPYPPQYQQGYPGQPAPPYAPPQAPQYEQPQQGYAPAPGYPAQQPYQQAAQQGYAPPQPPVQPAGPPVAPPSLKDFMSQPASGGNSLSFMNVGTRYSGTVVRTVTHADVDEATEMNDRNKIAKYNDGRRKLIMKVPLLLDAPTPQYPDGTATWIVKGNERNELMRAMEAAGAVIDPEMGFYRIQAGDHIVITYTHDQPSRSGLNPRKVKAVEYVVGNGVPPQMPVAAAIPATQPVQAPPQPLYGQGQVAAQFYSPTPGTSYQLPQPVNMPSYAVPQPAFQDPVVAYQQATGQPMQPAFDPAQAQQFQAQYQQPSFPTPGAAPPATPGYGNGAPQTAPAFPSSQPGANMSPPPSAMAPQGAAPGSPPPEWPADVPFIPGLTPDMARVAAAMHHPAASGQ